MFVVLNTIAISFAVAIIFFLIGGAVGWLASLKVFKKQLKENPPINEVQIRDLYKQLGRKPTEKQIQQIMSSFKK